MLKLKCVCERVCVCVLRALWRSLVSQSDVWQRCQFVGQGQTQLTLTRVDTQTICPETVQGLRPFLPDCVSLQCHICVDCVRVCICISCALNLVTPLITTYRATCPPLSLFPTRTFQACWQKQRENGDVVVEPNFEKISSHNG